MPTTLLKTKLYIPPIRPKVVARPHLIRQLNEGLHRKLTLVSAPPGFGKTTILSEWAHQKSNAGPLVAWVSLDELDNDPVRFWTYVTTALDTVQPDMAADAIVLLQEPQAPPIEEILTVLINTAAEMAEKVVLVLDDYHIIENEQIHQALTFLTDHMPPQMHIMLTSRSDPALPLTRLRVRSQLTELRDNDLRFSAAEAAIFLNQIMALDISPEDMTALESRTEGWIAGLQLAALSMQGRGNATDFVRAFTGSHRYIIDYLAEEVLVQQPGHIRTFLLRTSILNRLCGPLCDAVLNRQPAAGEQGSDGQEILEYLEQTNLFLIPLDNNRRWYRYHHLFVDFLREYLRQTVDQNTLTHLHRRASRWYAANRSTSDAINHALAAEDLKEAVYLIEKAVISMLTAGEVGVVKSWLNSLPEEVVQTRPRLGLGRGWVMIIMGQTKNVEPVIEAAEKALSTLDSANSQEWDEAAVQSMWGEAATMRAMFLSGQGKISEAVELCKQALKKLPKDSAVVRSILMTTLGNGYEIMGDLDKASEALGEAAAIAKSNNNIIIALTATSNLARLEEEKGNLYRAAEFYQQGVNIVEDRAKKRGQPFPGARWVYTEIAELHREWNNLEEAKQYLTLSFEMKRQVNMMGGNIAIAYLVLARILQAEGDTVGAIDAIEFAKKTLPQTAPTAPWVDAIEARLRLAQGDLAAAVQWAQNSNLSLDDPFNYAGHPHYNQYPGEYTTLVRILIAQERFEDALTLLQRMQTEFEALQRPGRLVEIFVLKAVGLYAQGNVEQALPPLAQALPVGEAGKYIRVFADEGHAMAHLLRLVKSRGLAPNPAYVDRLLAACDNLPLNDVRQQIVKPKITGRLIEPLSSRELEVLQLVADGLSNREIAEKLYITIGTAKTHTINIYRKLDVRSRTQAVAKAQALGFL